MHVVHPSREGEQLRGLLLSLIRQALAPLVHEKVGGCWGSRGLPAFQPLLCMRLIRHGGLGAAEAPASLPRSSRAVFRPPPPPLQAYHGNPNPEFVSHFALLTARQGLRGRGTGHFTPFCQAMVLVQMRDTMDQYGLAQAGQLLGGCRAAGTGLAGRARPKRTSGCLRCPGSRMAACPALCELWALLNAERRCSSLCVTTVCMCVVFRRRWPTYRARWMTATWPASRGTACSAT